ncbi:SCO family protein [Peribacillus simplex]|uniref:SCO family protein n=1 Tax=Peribacillus simplex TaxID=1478 RepID=UPI00119E9BFB|nr:SCO family protein [Peribacillus simplex]
MRANHRLLTVIISLVILLGFFFAFSLWRESKEIPVLDKADPFVMNTISGEQYHSDNKKVKLLTFFYTRCPDICPMTLYDFKDLQLQLQNEGLFGTKVELLAITLDPENDSNEVISDYASAFNANSDGWKFMRGTPEETKEITDTFKMKYEKVSDDVISHNTSMYLIDQENRIRGLFNMANTKEPVDKEEIMDTVRKLIKE